MSEFHKFIFEGMPVRGMIVRLDDAWLEVLKRRAVSSTGPYPPAVQQMLGEMTAAAALMQGNIQFNGALVLQIQGDGPVKLAVVEVQSDLRLRATVTLRGEVPQGAGFADLVNRQGLGRCAITLDPLGRQPGQQPYQGVVPLTDDQEQPLNKLSDVLELYMRQSEQLETKLVLASNETLAAGLLIQRLPIQGAGNLEGLPASKRAEIEQLEEDYNRIATLAASLKAEELLSLDVDTILRRLFWEEKLQRFEPELVPRFHCTCSRERVSQMIQSLGEDEAQDIISEQGSITVDCDFCGARYVFDSVQAAQIFKEPGDLPPSSPSIQ